MHGHAVAGIHSLVDFPRSTEEGINSRRWTGIPADGKLSAFPLKPQHEFLCGGRSRVALCIAENKIEADVTWRTFIQLQRFTKEGELTFEGRTIGPGPLANLKISKSTFS